MHLRCTYGRTYDAPTARFVDFGCSKFRKEIDSNIDLPPDCDCIKVRGQNLSFVRVGIIRRLL